MIPILVEHSEAEVEKLGLNDRASDIWRPLFTVLLVVGRDTQSKEWGDLVALATEMHADTELADLYEKQLAVLRAFQEKESDGETLVGMTTELLEFLKGKGIDIDIAVFNHFMGDWEFEQKSRRIGKSKEPRRVWVIPVKTVKELERGLKGSDHTPGMLTTVTTLTTDRGENGGENDQKGFSLLEVFGISPKQG